MMIHMLYAKVKRPDAERLRRLLAKMSLLDNRRQTEHSSSYIYFPLLNEDEKIKKLIDKACAAIITKRSTGFAPSGSRKSFSEMARSIRKDSQLAKLSGGYDVIGDISIMDTGNGISRQKTAALGRSLMRGNSHVKVVLSKAGPVSGKYRTRRLRYVCGEKRYHTVHKENGCSFFMDVRKTFFSPRLAYERARITSLVRDNEKVIVMFAGVGPFAVEIAKAHTGSHAVGIELNRDSWRYMKYNIRLNKLANADAVFGNVDSVSRKYLGYADRILMPLPMDSLRFIPAAIAMAKKRATIHIYAFCDTEGMGKGFAAKLRAAISATGNVSMRIVGRRIVRPYSAKESEIVFDVIVDKKQRKSALPRQTGHKRG